MNTRTFALIWGIVFLMLAATGFIPGLLQDTRPEDPHLVVDAMYGRALGLFPVNVLHSLVHLAFGIWGVLAYRDWDKAKVYAKAVAVIYTLFAIMGLVPRTEHDIRPRAAARQRRVAAPYPGRTGGVFWVRASG